MSPGRGYYYHPSRRSAGQTIVGGWAYQLVAELGFERDARVAPVDARRVKPEEDANDVAAEQVKALVSRLSRRDAGTSEPPLFVFDAGYDPVRLQRKLEGCHAQIPVRLHSGRMFCADRGASWPTTALGTASTDPDANPHASIEVFCLTSADAGHAG